MKIKANKMKLINVCKVCERQQTARVLHSVFKTYCVSGERVQDVWPDLPPNDREVISCARNAIYGRYSVFICEACLGVFEEAGEAQDFEYDDSEF